jgi:hypothetical protein
MTKKISIIRESFELVEEEGVVVTHSNISKGKITTFFNQ